MKRNLKVKIPEHVYFSIIDDECVLLNTQTGVFYGLDEIGTRMWRLIEEYGNLELVVQEILKEYEVTEDKLRLDISSLVESLHKAGLVKIN